MRGTVPAGALPGIGGKRYRFRRFAVPAGGGQSFPRARRDSPLWRAVFARDGQSLPGAGNRSRPGQIVPAGGWRRFASARGGAVSAGAAFQGLFLRRCPAPLDGRSGRRGTLALLSALGSTSRRCPPLPLDLTVERGLRICPRGRRRIWERRNIFPCRRGRPVLRPFSLPGNGIGTFAIQWRPGWRRWGFCRSDRRWFWAAVLGSRRRLTAPLRALARRWPL